VVRHGDVTATLIVSVSGLTPTTLPHCAEFATRLDSRLVPASWLLPPRPRDGRHLPKSPAIGFLRDRLHPEGVPADALVLHGFDHAVPPLSRPRLGRRAEFAGLPTHEASLRLIAAIRAMDELGLRSEVFAPPRWLSSPGTVVALRRRGFRVCADSIGVRLLDGSDRMLRGRVLSWQSSSEDGGNAGRGTTEAWRARSLVAAASRTARRGGLVRVAAEAAELARPATRSILLDAVDAALQAGAQPVTYRAPLPRPTPITA
jgi:uncharacterized protein